MSAPHLTLAQIKALPQELFVEIVGPVFEHSPWIAKKTFGKPFSSIKELYAALCETVRKSDEEEKLDLIRAHPDLVGRAALAGTLTRESTGEQASAGLDTLTPDEVALFEKQNEAYRAKFNFPFIICARLNKKEAILAGFEKRLKNSCEQEKKTALEEVFKIAELRLRDLITE